MLGILVGAQGLAFLPPLWAIFYLISTGDIFAFISSQWQLIEIALHFFPKSLATAGFIALVLMFRSITWGSISLYFTLAVCMIAAVLFDIVSRIALYFYPEVTIEAGFGHEYFISWLLAWLTAGIVFYGLLILSGFNQRYQISQRYNLRAAFWSAVIYVIYTPIIYSLIVLQVMYGKELAFIIAQGPITGRIEMVSVLISAILAYIVTSWLRRNGRISTGVIFILPFIVCFVFLVIYLIALPAASRYVQGLLFIEIFFLLALCLAVIGCILLRLLGIKGQNYIVITQLQARKPETNKRHIRFALFIFAIILLLGPPIWQCSNIILRSALFGLPPVSFFFSNIWIAYLHVGLIYGGLCALTAFFTGKIDFTMMFGLSIVSCLIGAIFPGSYLGISFGFFGDYIAWPMLAFFAVNVICWYILSCLPQIKRGK